MPEPRVILVPASECGGEGIVIVKQDGGHILLAVSEKENGDAQLALSPEVAERVIEAIRAAMSFPV
jgi:hypothetical protein